MSPCLWFGHPLLISTDSLKSQVPTAAPEIGWQISLGFRMKIQIPSQAIHVLHFPDDVYLSQANRITRPWSTMLLFSSLPGLFCCPFCLDIFSSPFPFVWIINIHPETLCDSGVWLDFLYLVTFRAFCTSTKMEPTSLCCKLVHHDVTSMLTPPDH